MRKYRTDYRLWALASGLTFVGLWAAAVALWPDGLGGVVVDLMRWRADARNVAGDVVVVALVFAGIAGPVGWSIQAALLLCGCERRRPAPGETADYDDQRAPGG